MGKQGKLIILAGISGSGKSTYAQKEWEKAPKKVVIVNRDKIRELLFGYNDSTIKDYYNRKDIRGLEKQVTEYHNELVLFSLSRGKTVIADNTHLKKSYLDEYQKFNVPMTLILFYEKPDECATRDLLRERRVGLKVISKQYKQFQTLVGQLNIKMDFNSMNVHIMDFKIEDNRNLYVPDFSKKECVVVDIDGTIADNQGKRSPYDWHKVDQDAVKDTIVEVVSALRNRLYKVIICTGRDGVCQEMTEKWLKDNAIGYDGFYIRKQGDQRPDYIIKEEMWNDISKTHNINLMIDDRRQVVDHARSLGYTVLDVANHTF